MALRIFFIAALAAVAVWILVHFIDKNRIQREIEARGGRVLSIIWNPLRGVGSLKRTSAITM